MKQKNLWIGLAAALLLLGGLGGCKKGDPHPERTGTSTILATQTSAFPQQPTGAVSTTQAASKSTPTAATATSRQPSPATTKKSTHKNVGNSGLSQKKPSSAGTTAASSGKMPVTTPPKTYEEAYEAEILRLVNQERVKAGLNPVRRSATLASAAMIRTREIQIKWSHERPDGSECFTVSDEVYGENLAFGFPTAREAMEAWMKSDGHRKVILHPGFRTLGVGQQNGYWVELFGY